MNIMDFFPFVFIRILEEVYPMDLSLQHQTNLVDIVYYQAIAEGICEYDDTPLTPQSTAEAPGSLME